MFEVKDANGEVVYRSDNFITISEKKEIVAIYAKEITLDIDRGGKGEAQIILKDENGETLAWQTNKPEEAQLHFKTSFRFVYKPASNRFTGHFEKRP